MIEQHHVGQQSVFVIQEYSYVYHTIDIIDIVLSLEEAKCIVQEHITLAQNAVRQRIAWTYYESDRKLIEPELTWKEDNDRMWSNLTHYLLITEWPI